MPRELKNWVAYGRFLCDRAYAAKPFDRGPRRCQSGRAATVAGIGIEVAFVLSALLGEAFGEEFVDEGRFAICRGRDRRITTRLVAPAALSMNKAIMMDAGRAVVSW